MWNCKCIMENRMVTKKSEAIHLMAILHRYLTEKEAYKMVCDMEFEIAEITDNESLRDSIKMVREYLKPSKPSFENLYICNCEHGHQNCKCDGETGKKVKQ